VAIGYELGQARKGAAVVADSGAVIRLVVIIYILLSAHIVLTLFSQSSSLLFVKYSYIEHAHIF